MNNIYYPDYTTIAKDYEFASDEETAAIKNKIESQKNFYNDNVYKLIVVELLRLDILRKCRAALGDDADF